ncbi:tRNA lysidine(34) synthetase TilS [bacterium]|nr:MAG: tRNA lysidine(34) synthetase TilS [bacterium]
MDCIKKVSAFLSKQKLIKSGDKVLVAVSGGPDSISLLFILDELKDKFGFEIAAAYFDHGIRTGVEREIELVRRYSSKLGIPFFLGAGDVPAVSKRLRLGIEEAARLERFGYLESTANKWGARGIALGHTADDQVETILHHIIRGSGLRGLAGIPASRGHFIRPILTCTRSELLDFLKSRKLNYAVDKTNSDTSLMRNRIRHRLIPYITKNFNPRFRESLLRLGENVAEALEALTGRLDGLVSAPDEGDSFESVTLKSSSIKGLSDFEIFLLVDSILKENFGIFQDVDKHHYDSVKRLISTSTSGKVVQLPFGIETAKEHGDIVFRRRRAKSGRGGTSDMNECTITGTGEFNLPDWGMRVTIEEVPAGDDGKIRNDSGTGYFRSIRFPLRIRRRKMGDNIRPFGMKGTKKLSDIFIDKKVPLSKRDRIPVFEDKGGIFWIPGVVSDERMRIGPKAKRAIRITIDKI